MGWTKRQFIDRAYSEIGMGPPTYTITPEDYADALIVIDSMVADWQLKDGVGIGYPLHADPTNANIDEETDVSVLHNTAVWSNLALLVASGIGREPMRRTKVLAQSSRNNLSKALNPPRRRLLPSNVPLGGGNRYKGRHFSTTPTRDSEVVNNETETL